MKPFVPVSKSEILLDTIKRHPGITRAGLRNLLEWKAHSVYSIAAELQDRGCLYPPGISLPCYDEIPTDYDPTITRFLKFFKRKGSGRVSSLLRTDFWDMSDKEAYDVATLLMKDGVVTPLTGLIWKTTLPVTRYTHVNVKRPSLLVPLLHAPHDAVSLVAYGGYTSKESVMSKMSRYRSQGLLQAPRSMAQIGKLTEFPDFYTKRAYKLVRARPFTRSIMQKHLRCGTDVLNRTLAFLRDKEIISRNNTYLLSKAGVRVALDVAKEEGIEITPSPWVLQAVGSE